MRNGPRRVCGSPGSDAVAGGRRNQSRRSRSRAPLSGWRSPSDRRLRTSRCARALGEDVVARSAFPVRTDLHAGLRQQLGVLRTREMAPFSTVKWFPFGLTKTDVAALEIVARLGSKKPKVQGTSKLETRCWLLYSEYSEYRPTRTLSALNPPALQPLT